MGCQGGKIGEEHWDGERGGEPRRAVCRTG